jgi:ABC-2 family transporter protein
MVYEYEYLELYKWLQSFWEGPLGFLIFGPVALIALAFIGFLVAAVRSGPGAAGEKTYSVISGSFFDLISLSTRRVGAIAKLVVLEAWRRKIWIVVIIFAGILLFANRFLNPTSQDPAKLYISFVFGYATRFLLLILMLVVSVFSIPLDFKNKTIFTVVTKPVSPAEVVLGRIVGFMGIGTVLLIFMGVASYLFLLRSLQHTHELDADTLTRITASSSENIVGTTTLENRHAHRVEFNPAAPEHWTEFEFGHRHQIIPETANGKTTYSLAEPEDLLRARVQKLGTLRFLDEFEKVSEKGVNTGKEWNYRSYIEGGSPAAAIWTFKDVTPENFSDGLTLEWTLRVFRTYQGKIDRPLGGTVEFRNPQTKVKSRKYDFLVKDNTIDTFVVPLAVDLEDENGNQTQADPAHPNFYEKLVDAEQGVEVKIQCKDKMQYLGMARRDLYLKAPETPFWWNLSKGLICIWLQMLIVVCCGVFFSTFVSAPVALLCTVGFLVMGVNSEMVDNICKSELRMEEGARMKPYYGGGPVEAFYRIIMRSNVVTPLNQIADDTTATVIKWIDKPMLYAMQGFNQYLVPSFDRYNTTAIVEQGFNVPSDLLIQLIFKACCFSFMAFLLATAFMRMREVAR